MDVFCFGGTSSLVGVEGKQSGQTILGARYTLFHCSWHGLQIVGSLVWNTWRLNLLILDLPRLPVELPFLYLVSMKQRCVVHEGVLLRPGHQSAISADSSDQKQSPEVVLLFFQQS